MLMPRGVSMLRSSAAVGRKKINYVAVMVRMNALKGIAAATVPARGHLTHPCSPEAATLAYNNQGGDPKQN